MPDKPDYHVLNAERDPPSIQGQDAAKLVVPADLTSAGYVSMCAIRFGFGDISNAVTIKLKRGDQDVREWSVCWYRVASDGTDFYDAGEIRQLASSGSNAKRVADLSLHQYDMNFCERLLKAHGAKFVGEYNDLSLALWIALLTKFVSCFQWARSRKELDRKQVYGSETKAEQDFRLLMALRDKHVVHDENNQYGAFPYACLDQNGDVRQIASMITVARIDPALVAVMPDLIECAQEYIAREIADAGKALFAEVQAMTPDARVALPKSISIGFPTHGDVEKTR